MAEDLFGNRQDFAQATSVSWIKSANAPFANLAKTPDPDSKKTSFKVVVSGTDVTQYKFSSVKEIPQIVAMRLLIPRRSLLELKLTWTSPP